MYLMSIRLLSIGRANKLCFHDCTGMIRTVRPLLQLWHSVDVHAYHSAPGPCNVKARGATLAGEMLIDGNGYEI